jgi:5'-deoxynucleotidase YfbR-like HD superfamily hydrolase
MLNLEELLNGSTRQMSHVIRYSSLPHGRGENVAEHTFYVVFYCLLIAKDLEKEGYQIDYYRLLISAVIHDLDEAITGDIIRPVKYSSEELRDMLERVANIYCRHTLRKLNVEEAEKIYDLWEKARDPATIEGQILQVCDMLSVIAYCIERIRSGNAYMQTILRGAYDNFLSRLKTPVYLRYAPQIEELCKKYYGDAEPQLMLLIDQMHGGIPANEHPIKEGERDGIK